MNRIRVASVVCAYLLTLALAPSSSAMVELKPKGDALRVAEACATFAAFPLPMRLEPVLFAWGPAGTQMRRQTTARVTLEPGGTFVVDEETTEERVAVYDVRSNSYERDPELGEFIYKDGVSYSRYGLKGKFTAKPVKRPPTEGYGVSLGAFEWLEDTDDLTLLAGALDRREEDGHWYGSWSSARQLVKKNQLVAWDESWIVSGDCREIMRTVTTSWMDAGPGLTLENFRDVGPYWKSTVQITLVSGRLLEPIKAPDRRFIR